MSERIQERPAETDPTRNRKISVELMRDFGNELDAVMTACEPVARPLERREPTMTEEEVREFAAKVWRDMDKPVVTTPRTSTEIPEEFKPFAERMGVLAGIGALHAPEDATVWHLRDGDRSMTLIHEETEGDPEKGYKPRATTAVTLVRPLAEGEQGPWDSTHVRVLLTFYRDPATREPAAYQDGEGRTWAQTSVSRTTGTVDRRGSFRFAMPDKESREAERRGEEIEPEPEVLNDAKPIVEGELNTDDFMHPSEAELKNALQALRELAAT